MPDGGCRLTAKVVPVRPTGVARCLVVQHTEVEGPYVIGGALATAGVDLELCHVYAGDAVPADPSGFDGVVVMGGPSSAASDAGFGSRRSELALLERAVDTGVPTLGVCLGAQLLALAGGASVYPMPAGAEVGWAPVVFTGPARSDALLGGLPSEVTVLHWHGDTFDLPPGAERLASSDRAVNQAFRLGGSAWGIQFHAEVDRGAVEAFVRDLGDDARSAGVDPEEIVEAADGHLTALAAVTASITERFASMVSTRRRTTE